MNRFLVAVDGSAASVHAAKKAQQLARGVDGSLTLVSVIAPVLLYGDGSLGVSSQMDMAADAGVSDIFKQCLAALDPSLATPATLTLRGQVAETLADVAVERGFDLVVVGNTGRGAVSRVLLGSVADRLVHICKLPVLVVR